MIMPTRPRRISGLSHVARVSHLGCCEHSIANVRVENVQRSSGERCNEIEYGHHVDDEPPFLGESAFQRESGIVAAPTLCPTALIAPSRPARAGPNKHQISHTALPKPLPPFPLLFPFPSMPSLSAAAHTRPNTARGSADISSLGKLLVK
jgi:hypothetical protein